MHSRDNFNELKCLEIWFNIFLRHLLVYQHKLTITFQCGRQINSIHTDFSKAFDTVIDALVLAKLKAIGFGDRVLSWIGSFLCDRIPYVRVVQDSFNGIEVTS